VKRPSHDLLMQVTDLLAKARDVEREAGNLGTAMVFNDLNLAIFKAALDTEFDARANAECAARYPEGGA
jgi:hypothetical protein